MAENKTSKESKGSKSEIVVALLKFLSPRNILALIIIIAIIAGTIFVKDSFFADSKTTKLGFENIGELATQSAYVTEVNVTENARDLFGLEIPFTQSKTNFWHWIHFLRRTLWIYYTQLQVKSFESFLYHMS